MTLDHQVDYQAPGGLAKPQDIKLCTNFTEFVTSFGPVSSVDGQRNLAHAVYGFFDNGGTRCYVARVVAVGDVDTALGNLDAIDEIALVAAPGLTDPIVRGFIISHCENTGDRFAILDAGRIETLASIVMPSPRSTYTALYFPWLGVFDPVEQATNPTGDGTIPVPPSGHMAGIYARVDTNRGVHKAPANEVVLGALGLGVAISKSQQGAANDAGVNCIRSLNGSIWSGARVRSPTRATGI